MASRSETALANSAEQPGTRKRRKMSAGRASGAKSQKRGSSKSSNPAGEKQSTETDVLPVMKLRAIDIIDDAKTGSASRRKSKAAKAEANAPPVIHMPPPENGTAPEGGEQTASGRGDALVTDPELVELLEQLSVTIDTANTVLDAAATVPGDENQMHIEDARRGPKPEPAPEPEPDAEDPPLAARLMSDAASPPPSQNRRFGFGLMVNTAFTGLVFAAGAAWLLHTNPWLLEGGSNAPVDAEPSATTSEIKEQAALPDTDVNTERAAAAPGPAMSSLAPPEDDPVPMETVTPPAPVPSAVPDEPVRGFVGQPIALNIPLPADPAGAETSVMVQDVPDAAELSAGKSLGGGNWLLSETQLDGLTLNTSKKFKPGDYELKVILVRSDGKVPQTEKLAVSVQPAVVGPVTPEPAVQGQAAKAKADGTAPRASGVATTYVKTGIAVELKPGPEAVNLGTPEPTLTPQEIRTLLTRGNTLLHEGDVAGARLLLEYAATRGSKQAMVKLGNSYDPKYLTDLGVRGVRPDEAKALFWYDRAAKATAAKQ